MKLKIRYENGYQEVEINTEDMKQLWISFDIEDEEMSEERLQEEFEERFNKPEYNNYHKHYRHWGMPKKAYKRDDEDTDETDGLEQIPDNTDEEERDRKYDREDVKQRLEKALPGKEEWVDILMAVDVDGENIRDYAARTGKNENNVTQKRKRALKKLKKLF